VAQQKRFDGGLEMNRRALRFSVISAALLTVALPLMAAAQGRYPDWRNDDRRNDRYDNRYDARYLRDSIHRLDRLAKDFQKDVDRVLDRSRADGTRREDDINREAREFRNAVGDLKSRFGNGRDLNRSQNEAQRVLDEGRQLDRMTRVRWFDSRLASEWSQIRRELNEIERAYGMYGYNDNSRRDPWWQRIPFPSR
jgi:hypothetical protein